MSERMPDRRHDRRADAYADRREAPRWDPRPSRVPSRQDPRWDRRDPRWNQHWDRGAGPRHDLYRGGRLPRDYRGSFYVVDDWRGHHLRQPPVGYHWVQTGGDYVLAAIATGVILSILLNH
jgi:Ni/Co efflux regulator RcnB